MVTRKDGWKTDRKQGKTRRTLLTPDTPYGECSERLTGFGGLLAMVKWLDLIEFEKIFHEHFVRPERPPKLGHDRMILGLLLLLFVGFRNLHPVQGRGALLESSDLPNQRRIHNRAQAQALDRCESIPHDTEVRPKWY